jgi:hypothetical protein
MSFSYIYTGEAHTDTSDDYMSELGMDDSAIEAVQRQESYQTTQSAATAQAWVMEQLGIADVQVNYHGDSDTRATSTEALWRAYRVELRDYVTADDDGTLTINGDAPSAPSDETD